MKVAVWDTYVTKKNGTVMHFDIIVPDILKDEKTIYGFGKQYLNSKGEDHQELSTAQCAFCHIQAVLPEWENEIKQNGYYIFEMENCN